MFRTVGLEIGNEQRADVERRFWLAVDRRGPDECWEWKRGRTSGGYGLIYVNKVGTTAQRVAYALLVGPVPEGVVVAHECDNPPCCNPKHLTTKPQIKNVRDAIDRGRFHGAPLGTRNGSAKLSDAIVQRSRERYAAGEIDQDGLAKELGVAQGTVLKFLHGRTWSTAGGPITESARHRSGRGASFYKASK